MPSEMHSPAVFSARHDDVLMVTIDSPPVNALSQAVRAGLLAAMEQAEADDDVRAVVIVGRGKAFVAGADTLEGASS